MWNVFHSSALFHCYIGYYSTPYNLISIKHPRKHRDILINFLVKVIEKDYPEVSLRINLHNCCYMSIYFLIFNSEYLPSLFLHENSLEVFTASILVIIKITNVQKSVQ